MAIAPENTLASFRLAAEQHTDFIELDVQESADGQVLVVHDSDLMKVGGNPTKIWDGSAAILRSVDIGTSKDPRYSTERVPTLAEALAACKGRCRVIVELKSYGHDQRLEGASLRCRGSRNGERLHIHVARSEYGAQNESTASVLKWGCS